MRRSIAVLCAAVLTAAVCGTAVALEGAPGGETIRLAQRGGSCKAVSSCEEAVILWCGGYSRADADGDGIPCENVCRSLAQVEAIKKKVDC